MCASAAALGSLAWSLSECEGGDGGRFDHELLLPAQPQRSRRGCHLSLDIHLHLQGDVHMAVGGRDRRAMGWVLEPAQEM